ncbi:uncharacterized protein LOC129753656 [Uranotaenia lowii]|uniref:uncharacterized protein LOC129753656 n=1 Tax=Uranotaenia lowii TaxID=190385 RepID=UPI002479A5C5|nr:uncharacterized protein LOC129753656 [Uranotaenia lowii]
MFGSASFFTNLLIKMEHYNHLVSWTKYFGFNTYELKVRKGGSIEWAWSRSGITLSLAFLAGYIYFSAQVLNPNAVAPYAKSGSVLLDKGGEYMLLLAGFGMITTMQSRFYLRNTLVKIIQQFLTVDKKMASLGMEIDFGSELRMARFGLGSSLIFITFSILLGVYAMYLLGNFPVGFFVYGGQIVVSFSGSVLANNSYMMYFKTYRRIRVLNENLRYEKSSKNLIENYNGFISEIALIFDDLYTLTNDISWMTLTEAIIYCIIVVMYGIETLFAAYRVILTGKFESFVSSGMHMIWWTEYCLGLLTVLVSSHLVKHEALDTQELLAAAMVSEKDELVRKKMAALVMQIRHNTPRITSWLFSLNLTMLGSVFTFLFIMIQFDN